MLGGCSLLPSKNEDKEQDPSLVAATGDPAFSLVVDAPKEVRELLEKHLELRRYRYQSDLQRRELTRLLDPLISANYRGKFGAAVGYLTGAAAQPKLSA
jgi:translocation and assembly module TamA